MQQAGAKTGNSILSIRPHEIKPLDLKRSPFSPPPAPSKAPAAGGGAAPAKPEPTAAATAKEGAKAESDYQTQQITLEVQGSYVALMRLLEALREFPKMIYVRSINIVPQQREGVYVIKTRIETYAIIIPPQNQITKGAGGETGVGNEH
jgi:hypothetical protein